MHLTFDLNLTFKSISPALRIYFDFFFNYRIRRWPKVIGGHPHARGNYVQCLWWAVMMPGWWPGPDTRAGAVLPPTHTHRLPPSVTHPAAHLHYELYQFQKTTLFLFFLSMSVYLFLSLESSLSKTFNESLPPACLSNAQVQHLSPLLLQGTGPSNVQDHLWYSLVYTFHFFLFPQLPDVSLGLSATKSQVAVWDQYLTEWDCNSELLLSTFCVSAGGHVRLGVVNYVLSNSDYSVIPQYTGPPYCLQQQCIHCASLSRLINYLNSQIIASY